LDVFNPRGTAPGIDVTVSRASGGSCRIFALPGVPAEMKEMFSDVVAGRISQQIGVDRQLIRNAVIKCFGLGESEMEARLGEMISRQSYPRVGITVSAATISLRITAKGGSEESCDEAIELTRQEIHAKAGEFVYGEGEDFELHNAVAEILDRRNERIAVIEVGHAAPVSHWFADVPQHHVFAGGRVFTNFTSTVDTLNRLRAEFDADWLVVVDRYPSLRNPTSEPAEVNVAVIGPRDGLSVAKSYRLGGHPSIVHPRIGKAALALVRTHLLSLVHHPIMQPQRTPS
jgi:nicotinamide-nucleotide amidase